MSIFRKSYPHSKKVGDKTMKPDKDIEHVNLKEGNSLKR